MLHVECVAVNLPCWRRVPGCHPAKVDPLVLEQSAYLSRRGSIACSPVSTMTMRFASV
jgi:hypothetical protein